MAFYLGTHGNIRLRRGTEKDAGNFNATISPDDINTTLNRLGVDPSVALDSATSLPIHCIGMPCPQLFVIQIGQGIPSGFVGGETAHPDGASAVDRLSAGNAAVPTESWSLS